MDTDLIHSWTAASEALENKWTCQDVSLGLCLNSRVAVVGPNGAGKSTVVKLLLGELQPEQGSVFRHSGTRVAYVAQQALFHLDQHLNDTPTAYILWRFRGNDDNEGSSSQFRQEQAYEEYKLQQVDWTWDVHEERMRHSLVPSDPSDPKPLKPVQLYGRRRNRFGQFEYEVGLIEKDIEDLRASAFDAHNLTKISKVGEGGFKKVWLERATLVSMGYERMVCKEDERLAAEKGLMMRPLTQEAVEEHCAHFGLSREACSHTPIAQLAAGEKIKVVLAASMWLNPHIVILDEPTNYLDRHGLAALTKGLKNYGGGVVVISHNQVINESESFVPFVSKVVALTDAAGNVTEVVGTGSNAKKKELKRQLKELEKQQKKLNNNHQTTEDVKTALADKIANLREP